jgi:hypothetical protein
MGGSCCVEQIVRLRYLVCGVRSVCVRFDSVFGCDESFETGRLIFGLIRLLGVILINQEI